MNTSADKQVTIGASLVFVLALVSLRFSDVQLDAFSILVVLLIGAVVRIISAARPPKPSTVGNSIRTGLVVLAFAAFVFFGESLQDLISDTAPATLGLAALYGVTIIFLTTRSRAVSVVFLAIAAPVISLMSGANPWWLMPLAVATAFSAAGYSPDRQLPAIGILKQSSARTNTVKALAFAAVAALLALWLLPDPPSSGRSGGTDVIETPATPPPPPTARDWSWLIWLLLLFVLVVLALLLWWYLKRRRQPWPTRALRRFSKAGARFGHPLRTTDTLPQFASRFPPVVGDLPNRLATALDTSTYSQRTKLPGTDQPIEAISEPELRSLERLAKTHQRNNRRNRLKRIFRSS